MDKETANQPVNCRCVFPQNYVLFFCKQLPGLAQDPRILGTHPEKTTKILFDNFKYFSLNNEGEDSGSKEGTTMELLWLTLSL